MIELLLVIVILSIVATAVMPKLGAGTERVRLTTAARCVVQASRYARTMALLHQAETELVLDPSTGTINVRARATGYKGDVLRELSEAEMKLELENAGKEETFSGDEEEGVNTNLTSEIVTAQSFADAIDQSFENKGISYAFLGYTDRVDNDSAAPEVADNAKAPIVLVFKSNGTCRPFQVRAFIEDGAHFDVTVDSLGKAKIEDYGDED